MRKPHICSEHTVRQAGERLLGGIRVNGAQAAEMTGVERLQKIEGFRPANLANQNAIRSVPQGRAEQISDGDRGQRRLLPERSLGSSRFQSKYVRFVEVNFRSLFDENDSIAIRNVGGQRVQKRRLSRAGAARDKDVLFARYS